MSSPFFIPAPARDFSKRKWMNAASTPMTGAPVLLAATYQVGTSVTLTFDRAVNVTMALPDAIVVRDGAITQQAWIGSDLSLQSSTVVLVELVTYESEQDPVTVLVVDGSNDIRNANDGEVWSGTGDLALPFP